MKEGRIISIEYQKQFLNAEKETKSITSHYALVSTEEMAMEFMKNFAKRYNLMLTKDDDYIEYSDFGVYNATSNFLNIKFFIDYDGKKIIKCKNDLPFQDFVEE